MRAFAAERGVRPLTIACTMGIKEQISDAQFLSRDARYVGALSILLLAVAASSRRKFPKGTVSWRSPKKEMGDQEAFTLFLGGRIRRFLTGSNIDRPGDSGLVVRVAGNDIDLAVVLYKHYRCALVHEGHLPIEVEFLESATAGGFAVRVDTTLQLDLSLLQVLGWVVEEADCNADLYGRAVYDVVPRSETDPEVTKLAICTDLDVSLIRLELLFSMFFEFDTSAITDGSDDDLKNLFRERFLNASFSGAPLRTLVRHGIADAGGNLLTKGIAIVRRVASDFHRIQVS